MIHECKQSIYFTGHKLSDTLFDESSLFFDIETTGFSPAHCQIYLIGCAYRKDNQICTEQFFAENKEEEAAILSRFMELLSTFQTLISFNGLGFDIPFLKAKCEMYNINESFSSMNNLDIFKSVSTVKFLLKLENYKQKTIEAFLDLKREDRFSGGELINVYERYTKNQNKEDLSVLLLHNYEDIIGMPSLLPILSYVELFQEKYTIEEAKICEYRGYDGKTQNELLITLHNEYPVPKRASFQFKDYYLVSNDYKSTIRIPLYEGELRYFYADYKNYYYLPEEDIALHKSVASYVDKSYRENARASNCYNRKTSRFLPQYEEIMNPVFKKEYKDSTCYFELTEDFCQSDSMLRRYVNHILKLMIHPQKRLRKTQSQRTTRINEKGYHFYF